MKTRFSQTDFLKRLIVDFPNLSLDRQAGRIYPARESMYLIRAWPQKLTKEDIEFLNKLCRKLDITKDVSEYYEVNWKRSESSASLDLQFWPTIIAVLLAYPHDNEDNCGQALKQLNTALTAIDLFTHRGGTKYLKELKLCAEDRLKFLIK